jgi:D-arginine dehydrogenase
MDVVEADVVVIGGGIAGLSIAAEIAEGLDGKVLVVEQEEHPGYHATGRSAAILAETYGTDAVRSLTSLSLPLFPNDSLRARGLLYIAIAGETPDAPLTAGPTMREISVSEAVALSPVLKPESIAYALYDPSAADIDVHRLQTEALRRLRERGGRLLTEAGVTAARRNGDRWSLVCGGLKVEAQIVINAAGAWAQQVGALFGAQDIDLVPKRRSAALVTLGTDIDLQNLPMVVDLGETVYFKPEPGGLMVSPADETPSPACDSRPEEIDIAIGVDRFEQISQFAVRRVTHTWSGLRTFAPDRNPVVGFDTVAPDFFWVAGQGGIGVQTSPAIASIGADLIFGRAPRLISATDLCSQLSPGRFKAASV